MRVFSFVILLFLFISGCMNLYRYKLDELVMWKNKSGPGEIIKKGMGKNQVEDLIGEPSRRYFQSADREVWVYSEDESGRISLSFDKDKLIEIETVKFEVVDQKFKDVFFPEKEK